MGTCHIRTQTLTVHKKNTCKEEPNKRTATLPFDIKIMEVSHRVLIFRIFATRAKQQQQKSDNNRIGKKTTTKNMKKKHRGENNEANTKYFAFYNFDALFTQLYY